MPIDRSLVAANISKIRSVRQQVLLGSGIGRMKAINILMDFQNLVEKKTNVEGNKEFS